MSEIADLENRLSAALDRIAQGLDQFGNDAGSSETAAPVEDRSGEIAALKAALEEERGAKAALETKLAAASVVQDLGIAKDDNVDVMAEIAALKQAHEAELDRMRMAAAAEREAWEGLNSRLVRMRRSNKLMRTNTIALRQAAADMVVDATLINQSLQVELDALLAAQELERAEVDVVLKTLQPMLGEPKSLNELEETV